MYDEETNKRNLKVTGMVSRADVQELDTIEHIKVQRTRSRKILKKKW
jgi:hypothetical protein